MTGPAKRLMIPLTFVMALSMLVAAVFLAGKGDGHIGTEPTPISRVLTVAPVSTKATGMEGLDGAAAPGPDLETLRRRADYVSPDGSYVKIGSVEISAIGPVSRPDGTH